MNDVRLEDVHGAGLEHFPDTVAREAALAGRDGKVDVLRDFLE